jgi:hypothetical protein
MIQIGHVKEINEVKEILQQLQEKEWLEKWELPHESLLTRLSAAIFFLSIKEHVAPVNVWEALEGNAALLYKKNDLPEISRLEWQVTFNKGFEL